MATMLFHAQVIPLQVPYFLTVSMCRPQPALESAARTLCGFKKKKKLSFIQPCFCFVWQAAWNTFELQMRGENENQFQSRHWLTVVMPSLIIYFCARILRQFFEREVSLAKTGWNCIVGWIFGIKRIQHRHSMGEVDIFLWQEGGNQRGDS